MSQGKLKSPDTGAMPYSIVLENTVWIRAKLLVNALPRTENPLSAQYMATGGAGVEKRHHPKNCFNKMNNGTE